MKRSLAILLVSILAVSITSCDNAPDGAKTSENKSNDKASTQTEQPSKDNTDETSKARSSEKLASILAKGAENVKARYAHRHPQETLTFIGIQPGMTVVEALPGRGWYSKILLPYLGAEGRLIGADYAADMFPKFGFFSDEVIESKKTWVKDWPVEAEGWRDEASASISAFQFSSMPDSMNGSADAVLFIRALHNLARFEHDGGYLTAALSEAYRVLKPGGIVGVVQHMASPDASDEWASGAKGYLKKAFVVAQMEKAGFDYVASSDININPNDQPTEKDVVWRLSPSFATSRDNPELKEKLKAIGESTRMTLVFRKPSASQ
ncbi:class I SAM-dependent methyltransferase [Aliikangiella coralliicola]|uniref:Class I SAM-dependent methyltransferase n=1 Tax=Aliikangiella coralliicola TaxID=2592383 RepID=A0A545UC43_9GAMM|nr:methyltransferase domain-containing protein [Aliikangiella coralliicola]TQV87032.1 class I SAM-dependent methyltransferase [Aliikangiella coralliicola]